MSTELRYVKFNKDFKDIDAIKRIYELSFPSNERFFSVDEVLSDASLLEFAELTAVYDGETLVGFYVVTNNTAYGYKYLQFIAVDTTIRGKGYGGRILVKLLDENMDKVFFGSIEQPVPGDEGYEMKLRRQHFYERNGMIVVDYEREVNGVSYIIVTNRTGVEFDRSYEHEVDEEKKQLARIRHT